jgi:hypothetical protein
LFCRFGLAEAPPQPSFVPSGTLLAAAAAASVLLSRRSPEASARSSSTDSRGPPSRRYEEPQNPEEVPRERGRVSSERDEFSPNLQLARGEFSEGGERVHGERGQVPRQIDEVTREVDVVSNEGRQVSRGREERVSRETENLSQIAEAEGSRQIAGEEPESEGGVASDERESPVSSGARLTTGAESLLGQGLEDIAIGTRSGENVGGGGRVGERGSDISEESGRSIRASSKSEEQQGGLRRDDSEASESPSLSSFTSFTTTGSLESGFQSTADSAVAT